MADIQEMDAALERARQRKLEEQKVLEERTHVAEEWLHEHGLVWRETELAHLPAVEIGVYENTFGIRWFKSLYLTVLYDLYEAVYQYRLANDLD